MSYRKEGTVHVDGKEYQYTVYRLSSGEYCSVVPGCRGACKITSYEIEEHHIITYIIQSQRPDDSEIDITKVE